MENKEFIYEDTYHEGQLVCKGEYNGYKYYVLSFGKWPCVYVKLNHTEVKEGDFDTWEWVKCHGGITYVQKMLKADGIVFEYGNFIGLDFNHVGDKNNVHTTFGRLEGKAWTTDEIIAEAYKVIDQVSKKNL